MNCFRSFTKVFEDCQRFSKMFINLFFCKGSSITGLQAFPKFSEIPVNFPKIKAWDKSTSDAWHIPRYPTRKHCIISIYDTIQPYTSLHNPIWHYTALYQSIQPYTTIYSPIQVYTFLYDTIQYSLIPVYTGLYATIQPYTSLYSPIRHYTSVCQFVHPYTTLYSPIRH